MNMPGIKRTEKRKLGDIGEDFAVEHLKKNGYKIIQRNYLKPFGEIDIVTKKNGEYIFVEVKTSKFYPNSSFSPEFRVDRSKIEKLRRVCEFYGIEQLFQSKQKWQLDVISIILNPDQTLRSVEQIENIYFN
jgi:putative endonuclease